MRAVGCAGNYVNALLFMLEQYICTLTLYSMGKESRQISSGTQCLRESDFISVRIEVTL